MTIKFLSVCRHNEAFIAQKRLCEKHLNDAQKYFGVSNSYVAFFNEFVQIVQHIIDAENLISCSFEIHASSEGKTVIEDERRQFKRWKSERSKLSSELKAQTRIIDDEIKRYRDKYRDMIKAKEDYERINADQSHSQFDVEKALSSARLKEIDFDRSRNDYSAALDQFNLYRKDYYLRCLPLWAQVGKGLEHERYTRTQSLISILHERLRVAIDRMTTVCEEFQSVSTHLNSDQDSEEIISALRSNNPPPGDIAFVDLSSTSLSSTPQTAPVNNTKQGSVVLPPNFHCSVWAADHAAMETSRQYHPQGEVIYSESGSIHSASYASTTVSTNGPVSGNTSRRPSVCDSLTTASFRHPSQQFYSSNGAGFLRRIFSRRSRHNSLNVSCEITSGSDGVVSGWSNPFFEPVVPWRKSSRQPNPHRHNHEQQQQHYYTRNMNSFRKKFSSRRLKFTHQRTIDDNDGVNGVKDSLDMRASQSTGDLSVVNLKTIADLCDPNRIKRQGTFHQTTGVYDAVNSETHASKLMGGRSRDNIVIDDASDFSDSCSELDNDEGKNNPLQRQIRINSIPPSNDNVAYASTSVLSGLPKPVTSQYPTSLPDMTKMMTNNPPVSHHHPGSDSQAGNLSSGRERSSIPLHYLATLRKKSATIDDNDDDSGAVNHNDSCNRLSKQEKPYTAPLAEPETASIVPPAKSGLSSRPTSSTSSSLNQMPGSLNGQMPTLKQNLLTAKSISNNTGKNTNNSKYPSVNGNVHSNCLDSNRGHQTLIYSQMESSYNYSENKNMLKNHEQQRLWLSQQQEESSQFHQQKQRHQNSSPQALNNSESSSTISASSHNNQYRKSSTQASSQIVAIGDCSSLYSFTGDGFESCYLAFEVGEQFYILANDPTEDTTDWLHVCRMRTLEIGYVPTAYVQQNLYSQPMILSNCKSVQIHDSDSSSTTKTSNVTFKRPSTISPTPSTMKSGVGKSSENSITSNKSINPNMMNRNFRGTSPYVRLSGVSRDTDL
ncbi:unnamed protein product [Heterobilharzia americana]|nr:unnamed protein product [Heterobilharzia americana]